MTGWELLHYFVLVLLCCITMLFAYACWCNCIYLDIQYHTCEAACVAPLLVQQPEACAEHTKEQPGVYVALRDVVGVLRPLEVNISGEVTAVLLVAKRWLVEESG